MSTQNIKKEELQYFYGNVCNDWKLKISELVLFQTGAEITVPNSLINEAYEAASEDLRKRLRKVFKIESEDDLFDITSYEELCKLKGIKVLTEEDFKNSRDPKKALAFEKIKIIEEIYNKDWKPNFKDGNQRKWYPYFVNNNGSWRFNGSGYFSGFYGDVGLYKDEKTSNFVGRTFMDLYLQVI